MPADAEAPALSADPALFLRLASIGKKAAADLQALKTSPVLKTRPVLKTSPGLKTGKARRWRKRSHVLRLLDTAEGNLRQAGWLCAAIDDTPLLLPLLPALPDPPMIEDLGALQILARGTLISETWISEACGLQLHAITLEGRQYHAVQIDGPRTNSLGLATQLTETCMLYWDGVHPLVQLAQQLGLVPNKPLWANQIPLALPQPENLHELDALSACCAMLRHALAQVDGNISCLLAAQDSEGVHQMRVALRRLRSVLALHRGLLPADAVQTVRAELAWLNAPLGRRRDLDVFVEETLAPLRRALPDLQGLHDLAIHLDEKRAAAQQALLSAFRSPRFTRLRLALEALCHQPPATEPPPALQYAALLLQRRRRKLKKLGRRLGECSEAELHELRILAKKLRYAVEFYRPLFKGRSKSARRHAQGLARLQDALGALNDAAVGAQLLRNLLGMPAEDPVAAAIAGWFAARQHGQLAGLPAAWEAYAELKPFWKAALLPE
ncbi:CHAD domain-containing protein [Ferrovibrio sp.]|uniref:CHAD domain-containing protein n=1 Tax=Ferrovibrio sp. TaxID=1917215 RepID=UPI0035AFCF40